MSSRTALPDVYAILHLTVRAIVKDRNDVSVEILTSPNGDNVCYRVQVSERDRAIFQGRGGQIARALRIVFHAIGQEQSVNYQLDL